MHTQIGDPPVYFVRMGRNYGRPVPDISTLANNGRSTGREISNLDAHAESIQKRNTELQNIVHVRKIVPLEMLAYKTQIMQLNHAFPDRFPAIYDAPGIFCTAMAKVIGDGRLKL